MKASLTPGSGERDRGAAMVELALILPILILLLVGIIEFGIAYNRQITIQGAAREGARALALGESAGDVDAAVYEAVGDADIVASITSINKTGCPSDSTSDSTAYATVEVIAEYTFSIPFVDLGSVDLTATARMRCGL
jgi:Flp pilus assembly protein TadG